MQRYESPVRVFKAVPPLCPPASDASEGANLLGRASIAKRVYEQHRQQEQERTADDSRHHFAHREGRRVRSTQCQHEVDGISTPAGRETQPHVPCGAEPVAWQGRSKKILVVAAASGWLDRNVRQQNRIDGIVQQDQPQLHAPFDREAGAVERTDEDENVGAGHARADAPVRSDPQLPIRIHEPDVGRLEARIGHHSHAQEHVDVEPEVGQRGARGECGRVFDRDERREISLQQEREVCAR